MIASLIAAVALSSTCTSQACVVRQVAPVVKRQVVKQSVAHSYAAIQPAYASQTLYFVGAPVRVESMVEQQKRSDPDWQEFLQFKAFRAGVESQKQTQQQQQTHTGGASSAGLTVREACAACHGKPSPAGEFFLDGAQGIEASRVTKAIRAIATGEMPKDRKLTREQKNALLADLLKLEEEQTPPIPEGPIE